MGFVKERVAPYKRIREVEFRKELPMSSAGKVLKRFLKKTYYYESGTKGRESVSSWMTSFSAIGIFPKKCL